MRKSRWSWHWSSPHWIKQEKQTSQCDSPSAQWILMEMRRTLYSRTILRNFFLLPIGSHCITAKNVEEKQSPTLGCSFFEDVINIHNLTLQFQLPTIALGSPSDGMSAEAWASTPGQRPGTVWNGSMLPSCTKLRTVACLQQYMADILCRVLGGT